MLWECLLLFIARSLVVFPLFLPYPKLGNTVLARAAPLWGGFLLSEPEFSEFWNFQNMLK
jgi:hypothetical protein